MWVLECPLFGMVVCFFFIMYTHHGGYSADDGSFVGGVYERSCTAGISPPQRELKTRRDTSRQRLYSPLILLIPYRERPVAAVMVVGVLQCGICIQCWL